MHVLALFLSAQRQPTFSTTGEKQLPVILLERISSELRRRCCHWRWWKLNLIWYFLLYGALCSVILRQNRGPWAVILHGISRNCAQIVSGLGGSQVERVFSSGVGTGNKTVREAGRSWQTTTYLCCQ